MAGGATIAGSIAVGVAAHHGNLVFVGSSVVAGAYGHIDGSRLDRISSCLALWATLA